MKVWLLVLVFGFRSDVDPPPMNWGGTNFVAPHPTRTFADEKQCVDAMDKLNAAFDAVPWDRSIRADCYQEK